MICSTSFPIAARELANSRSATAEKIGIAKPPFFTGKESRSRSFSEHMWLSVIARINTLSTIASKSHVLLEVTHCSYVIPQYMFGSAHKCCISCLWFCLCNLVQEFQLVAPRTYQFLSVYPPGYFLPSVLMLILVPPKTSRVFSSPVGFMTSHDFEAFGLHPNLGPYLEKFSIHSVQLYDTDALILAFSWLQIIKVRPGGGGGGYPANFR